MSVTWKATAACDPATRNGRRRIARGYLHADKGGGKSFCGSLNLASGDFGKRLKCARCDWILRLLACKENDRSESKAQFKKVAPALFAILNILAANGVLVVTKDKLPHECLTGELLERTGIPDCFAIRASRLQWVAMRFPKSPVLVIP